LLSLMYIYIYSHFIRSFGCVTNISGRGYSATDIRINCKSNQLFNGALYELPIPVAARSKAWVYGRSFTGIVGSNPA
jgi:hypothetical protein